MIPRAALACTRRGRAAVFPPVDKNAYLKRKYKKEKCIHYVAHFFCRPLPAGYLKCTHMHAHTKSLPSGQAIFKKMYTFAGIFFRWFYVYTCILFFFSSPSFAGILPQQAYSQKYPSPSFTAFSHI